MSFLCACVVLIAFKIYFPNNLKVCTTVLLTIVTMLYIRFPGLNSCSGWESVPSYRRLSFSPTPSPGNCHSSLSFYEFSIVRFCVQVRTYNICLFVFCYLTYFTQHNDLKVHPCCHKDKISFLFMAEYFLVYGIYHIF